MKNKTPSLRRALPVSLAVSLFAGTVLPSNVRAQSLYVGSFNNFTVSEYNANTGAVIKDPLVSSANSVADPDGLALAGNTLYVANVGPGTVTAYDATTGAAAAGFTTVNTGGGQTPPSEVLAANGLLYVSVNGANTVNAYNAASGEAATGFTTITGLNNPTGLTLLGTTLYVSNQGAGTIQTYNALTGMLLNPNFLAGFSGANFLTVAGNTLYVSDLGTNMVSAYNALTGASLDGFMTITDPSRPEGVQVSGNTLYVANFGDGNSGTGSVAEYNATTGALTDAGFLTGLTYPQGLAITVPEPSTWAVMLGGVGLMVVIRRRRVRCG